MKKIILFNFIALFFLICKAQDYFPMKVGKYWISDVIDTATNSVIGIDSSFFSRFYMSGSDSVYVLKSMVHFFIGKDSIDSLKFYNHNTVKRDVWNKNKVMDFKLFQHTYNNGDNWAVGVCPVPFCYAVAATSVGAISVPAGTFSNCFKVSNNVDPNFVNIQDFIFAPNIGTIKVMENNKDIKRLLRYGLITSTKPKIKKEIVEATIYMNQDRNILNVIIPDGNKADLTVLNMLGNSIIIKSIHLSRNEIDLSKLPSGNYIIKLQTEKGQFTKLITKK